MFRWRMRGDDEGFTLIELTVSMLILLIVMAALGTLYVSVTATASIAKQREEATALADQVVEGLRSLPYSTVTGGMVNCGTELSGDSNIDASSSTNVRFKPAYDSTINEQIPTTTNCSAITTVTGAVTSGSTTLTVSSGSLTASNVGQSLSGTGLMPSTTITAVSGSTVTLSTAAFSSASGATYTVATPPLYPHKVTVVEDGTTFTQRAYVSYVNNAPSGQTAYWLTGIVSWVTKASPGVTKTVAVRSELFEPTGCLAATHPFSGPCQAFLYGTTAVNSGSISIQSTGSGSPISGLSLTSASLTLPEVLDNMEIEQSTTMQAQASSSGASITTTGGTTCVGQSKATVQSDTDPSTTTTGQSASGTLASGTTTCTGTGSSQSVSALGGTPSLTLNASSGDSSSMLNTVSNGTGQTCKDVDNSTSLTGTSPCGSASLAQGSTASAQLAMGTIAGRSLPSMQIASVAAPATPAYLTSARFTAANATYCPGTSGNGCAVASGTRTLGSVYLGGIPTLSGGDTLYGYSSTGTASNQSAGLLSSGNSLLSLTGYSDKAIATAGYGVTSANTKDLTTRTGTLSFWTANNPGTCTSYANNICTVNLASVTTARTYTTHVTGAYAASNGVTVTVDETATITIPAISPSYSGQWSSASSCESAACITTSNVTPLTVQLGYTVSHAGSTDASFTVNVDLGRLAAKATYKASPNG